MTGAADLYDVNTFRKLLLAAFTAETLPRFCEDRPAFRPIPAQFGTHSGLDDMVDEVLHYCETHRLFGELEAAVERENPAQYARFEPFLRAGSEEVAIKILKPGSSLLKGKYRVGRHIGRGGFGSVYLATDTLLAEPVAVKELLPALVGDEGALKRFLVEAKTTLKLAHPHIVQTRDAFMEGSNCYMVMEYVPGGSLEDRLAREQVLTVDDAVHIVAEVADGLAYAHAKGVVHCDLKPVNILFAADGSAKVADFGVASVSDQLLSRSWRTPGGFVAGTLPYMSPEQVDGVRDDPRVDVYALGAVLYRVLAGRTYLDFDQRDTPGAQADNVVLIRSQSPAPPSACDAQIPAWLDAVVLRALAKRPEDRYAGVEQMRAALLRGEAVAQPVAESVGATGSPAEGAMPAAAGPSTPLAPGPAVRRAPLSGLAARLATGLGIRLDRQPRKRVWLLAGVAGVLLLAVVVGLAAMLGNGQAGKSHTQPPGGMEKVHVPAGEFMMGSTRLEGGVEDDESPQRSVWLDGFWIDRTEVTNAHYRQCVEAGACRAPLTCYEGEPAFDDDARADDPVVCVSYDDALAYCTWAGARLPTEAEWEKAARGGDGRTFPWGNELPDCTRANYACGSGRIEATTAVGSYPGGASPYGALDMAGNVEEWVADWYAEDAYAVSPARNPAGPDSGEYRVLRGGAWRHFWDRTRTAARSHGVPDARWSDIGFRCVDEEPGE